MTGENTAIRSLALNPVGTLLAAGSLGKEINLLKLPAKIFRARPKKKKPQEPEARPQPQPETPDPEPLVEEEEEPTPEPTSNPMIESVYDPYDLPVQGPLPQEPSDAPWKKSTQSSSGIRKL